MHLPFAGPARRPLRACANGRGWGLPSRHTPTSISTPGRPAEAAANIKWSASYAPDEERSVVIDNLGKAERAKALDAVVVDLVVQIACLALLAYWTVILLQPLLGIILWSVILAVLLYPAFDWMVRRLRVPRVLAALVLTVLTLRRTDRTCNLARPEPGGERPHTRGATGRRRYRRTGASGRRERVAVARREGVTRSGFSHPQTVDLREAFGEDRAAAQARGDRPAWIRQAAWGSACCSLLPLSPSRDFCFCPGRRWSRR